LVLDHFQSCFAYVDPVRSWLARFKYGGNLNAGRLLRALLQEYLRLHPRLLVGVDLIVPVPSHKTKLAKRGFNAPAFLLDLPGLHPQPQAAKKLRATEAQAGLHLKERQKNLSRSFEANPSLVEGKNILLFDDVCTTGSTLEELTIAMKRAGAERVGALVLARAVRSS